MEGVRKALGHSGDPQGCGEARQQELPYVILTFEVAIKINTLCLVATQPNIYSHFK